MLNLNKLYFYATNVSKRHTCSSVCIITLKVTVNQGRALCTAARPLVPLNFLITRMCDKRERGTVKQKEEGNENALFNDTDINRYVYNIIIIS